MLAKALSTVTLTVVLGAALCAKAQESEDKFLKEQPQTLSYQQVAAVILALEDEVYDYSQEKAFGRLLRAANDPVKAVTFICYINPHLGADASDGEGQVIYRNLTYGEIIRYFSFNPYGLVVWDNSPAVGFPMTQPSHLTEFMDHTELREDKAHWLHAKFTILLHPPREFVIQAAKRQIKRTGFSSFLKIETRGSK